MEEMLSKFVINPKIVLCIMFALILILFIFVLREYNFIGLKKGTAKTKKDVSKDKDRARKRNVYLRWLRFFENVSNSFGFKVQDVKIEKYKFYINRRHISNSYIERNLRPLELIGLFKCIKFLCCFFAVFFTILTGSRIFLLFFLGLLIDKIFETVMEMNIMEEDKEIEEDFPDLFLLLYSRLVKGTNTRLAPVLDDYIKSIDVIDGDTSHPAIRNLVLTLRKNIELYGDDSLAIHNMRGMYRSAMVVNFLNLAVQSLKGVDNREKLLAFKMELSQQKLESMKEKANKMVEKGQRVILLIYIILAEFVILSWVAKAGLSTGLKSFF